MQVRLSNAEHELLSAAAGRSRLALGAYLAQCAASDARGAEAPAIGDARQLLAELNQAWTAVSRIGTNLNQIAAVANTTGEVEPRLGPVLEFLRRVLDRLEQAAIDVDRRLP